ncbi:hypothetical protein D3C76_1152940 [compost metagenome]
MRNVHILDSAAIVSAESYSPPDPKVRELRSPIPAEHRMCLAQMGNARHGVGAADQRPLRLLAQHVFHGRAQNDVNAVFPDDQQRFDVDLVRAMHVVGV